MNAQPNRQPASPAAKDKTPSISVSFRVFRGSERPLGFSSLRGEHRPEFHLMWPGQADGRRLERLCALCVLCGRATLRSDPCRSALYASRVGPASIPRARLAAHRQLIDDTIGQLLLLLSQKASVDSGSMRAWSVFEPGRSVIGRLFFRFIGRFQGLIGRLSVDFASEVRSI
jgi:hypothetical protein